MINPLRVKLVAHRDNPLYSILDLLILGCVDGGNPSS